MRSGEYNVIALHFLYCSVNGYICLMGCVSDSVCELFGETIRNIKSNQIKNYLFTHTNKFIVYIRAKCSKVFTYIQTQLL